MSTPVYELVLYSASDALEADRVRADTRERVRALPGFRSYLALTNVSDPTKRADVVQWASLETAAAAAEAVQNHAEFVPFMRSVASVDRMAHFRAQHRTSDVEVAGGVELGFFRLKVGVTEAQARAAHFKAVDGYLSKQPGWIAEYFVRFDGGLYLDLLLAESRERAEAICGLWRNHPDCLDFVSLIEDVDMSFGSAI
jgi:heme-degrading monooxygenase HmoA